MADVDVTEHAGRTLDAVGVGIDGSGDDDLAEPERRFDHQHLRIVRPREHDARAVTRAHRLDDGGDRRFVGEAALGAVGDDTFAVQGGPAVEYPLDELVRADVGERGVHPGERRCGRVLGCRRRTHRDQQLVRAAVATQLSVGVAHLLLEVCRDACGENRSTCLGCDPGDLARFRPDRSAHDREQVVACAPSIHGVEERLSCDHEARRDGEPCRGELTQVGALATGDGDVLGTERGKATNRRLSWFDRLDRHHRPPRACRPVARAAAPLFKGTDARVSRTVPNVPKHECWSLADV